MKIVIENLSDSEVIPYPVILVKGRIENLDLESLKETGLSPSKHRSSKDRKFFITHKAHGHPDKVRTIQIFGGKFKILVKLHPGTNSFEFEFCRIFKHLSVDFDPPSAEWHPHRIALVYLVCAKTDGTFQAPKDTRNDVMSACRRISLAGALIQLFLGDSLDAHGIVSIPGRKSIQFEKIPSLSIQEFTPEDFFPPVHVFHSKLSMLEAHGMTPDEMWEFHAKELVAKNLGERIKFLVVTNATRYINPSSILPKDHEAVLALTKGHVALGGGGLGLFGSGCLYTWPETLEDVQARFLDSTPVNKKLCMDDSAYRGTVGGCFATSLGGLIHELGHMMDLGHTDNGIMARGCDDIDKFFTISNASSATDSNKRKQLLANCSRHVASFSQTVNSPKMEHFTRKGIQREGSSYLEEYQRKKYYRKMVQDCGGAFWNRSSALILTHHRWLNPSEIPDTDSDIRYDTSLNYFESDFPIVIVEVRDLYGNCVKFVEPDVETTRLDLEPFLRQHNLSSQHEIVLVNRSGTVHKQRLS